MFTHPDDPNSTSPAEWAKAFIDAHPEADLRPLNVIAWFHNAIEAGYLCRERNGELDI